jgi:hypothetical protein
MRIFGTNTRAQTKIGGPPARGLVEELTAPCCKKKLKCYKVLKGAFDLDKSFTTNQAMNKTGNLDILLTVHLSIIYFSLFPT